MKNKKAGMQSDYGAYQDDEDEKSKSQIKREMELMQKIGERLIKLPIDKLNHLNLDDQLLDAILLAKKIKAHEALRRQRQFIGKIMRGLDEEDIQNIQDYLETLDGCNVKHKQLLHFIENWRDKLLSQEDALSEFIQQYAQTDRSNLHQLIRSARKEKEQNKPPKAFRELFTLIKNSVLETE